MQQTCAQQEEHHELVVQVTSLLQLLRPAHAQGQGQGHAQAQGQGQHALMELGGPVQQQVGCGGGAGHVATGLDDLATFEPDTRAGCTAEPGAAAGPLLLQQQVQGPAGAVPLQDAVQLHGRAGGGDSAPLLSAAQPVSLCCPGHAASILAATAQEVVQEVIQAEAAAGPATASAGAGWPLDVAAPLFPDDLEARLDAHLREAELEPAPAARAPAAAAACGVSEGARGMDASAAGNGAGAGGEQLGALANPSYSQGPGWLDSLLAGDGGGGDGSGYDGEGGGLALATGWNAGSGSRAEASSRMSAVAAAAESLLSLLVKHSSRQWESGSRLQRLQEQTGERLQWLRGECQRAGGLHAACASLDRRQQQEQQQPECHGQQQQQQPDCQAEAATAAGCSSQGGEGPPPAAALQQLCDRRLEEIMMLRNQLAAALNDPRALQHHAYCHGPPAADAAMLPYPHPSFPPPSHPGLLRLQPGPAPWDEPEPPVPGCSPDEDDGHEVRDAPQPYEDDGHVAQSIPQPAYLSGSAGQNEVGEAAPCQMDVDEGDLGHHERPPSPACVAAEAGAAAPCDQTLVPSGHAAAQTGGAGGGALTAPLTSAGDVGGEGLPVLLTFSAAAAAAEAATTLPALPTAAAAAGEAPTVLLALPAAASEASPAATAHCSQQACDMLPCDVSGLQAMVRSLQAQLQLQREQQEADVVALMAVVQRMQASSLATHNLPGSSTAFPALAAARPY